MSDDQTSTAAAAPVHFEHYCDHPGCTKWGLFGKERGRMITEWSLRRAPGSRLLGGTFQPAGITAVQVAPRLIAQRNKQASLKFSLHRRNR